MDAGFWLGSSEAARAVMALMREREGLTTEELVALDRAERDLAELQTMLRGRMRARELGATPCPVCSGDSCVSHRQAIDTSQPRVWCQVCGYEMGPEALGVTDRVLPRSRYVQVEEALVRAWNARYEASAPGELLEDAEDAGYREVDG